MSAFTTRVNAAQEAIDRLFGETSVSPEETLEALEDLRDDIEAKIDAVKNDMHKAKER